MKDLSVIIPTYNASNFLDYNLRELCDDKYESLIDVLVVDDGSKDDTNKIVKKYTDKYSFVKYIYQNNSGAPVARNNGLNRISSNYVIFLDADDKINKNIFERLLDIIKNDEYDIISTNFDIIDENGAKITTNRLYDKMDIITGCDILDHINDDPKPGAKVYRTVFIKNNNIVFDDLKIGQDLNFYMKTIGLAKKILLYPESLYCYRIVNGSISRTYTFKILKIKDSFDKTIDFFVEKKMYDKLEEYIEIVKMCRYYSQFCKLRYFENKADRLIIYNFFKKEFKKLKINKNNKLFKKNKKIYYKFYIRLLLNKIFTSNMYTHFYISIKGKYHTS